MTANPSLHVRELGGSAVASNLGEIRFKCDFCDVTFKCDLDVSRHLSSASHNNNRNNFMSLQNLRDKNIEKQIPKNLLQVLQLLKLRSVKDLKDLTEKGFFEIQNEPLAKIADRFAKTLVKAVVEFDARNLPDGDRNALLKLFLKEFDKDNQQNVAPTASPITSSELNKSRQTTPATVSPSLVQQRSTNPSPIKPAAPTQPATINSNQSVPRQPVPLRTAPPPATQSQHRASPSTAQSKVPTQPSSSAPSRSSIPQQTQTRVPPTPSRVPATTSSLRVHDARIAQSSVQPRPIAPTPVRAPSASKAGQPQVRLQPTPTLSGSRPMPASVAARLAAQARTSEPPQPGNSAVSNGSDSSTTDSEDRPRRPVPRLDSTYVPKLGFIKSEPKD